MTRSIEELTRIHEITPDELEAAAKAIYQVSPAHLSGTTIEVPWDEAAPPYKECVLREAQAAITAFLEHRTKKGQGDE